MNNQILVSVVIPAYNRRKFIGEAVDSVLAQTYRNLEVIVVDDGSTDGTGDFLKEKYAGEPRFRYLWQKNAERSAARNAGIQAANGEFVAFLDSDDLWLPDKLEAQMRLFQTNPKMVMVVCWYDFIDYKSNILQAIDAPHLDEISDGDFAVRLMTDNRIGSPTPVIRRQVLLDAGMFCLDKQVLCFEDWELWVRVASFGATGLVPRILARHRVHPGNTGTPLLPKNYLSAAKNIKRQLSGKVWGKLQVAARKSYWLHLIKHPSRQFHQRLVGLMQGLTFFGIGFATVLLNGSRRQLIGYIFHGNSRHQRDGLARTRQPKISVIVPCYRQVSFLPEALASVQAQTFQDWECLIINDGSPDNTEVVAQKWVQSDARFRLLNKDNGGISSARNHGLVEARGEFIQFLDADDLLEPAKFSWQVNYLNEHPEVGIVYGDMQYFTIDDPPQRRHAIFGTNGPWMESVWRDSRSLLEKLLYRNIMGIHCPMIRRSVINKVGWFHESMHAMEDWDYWLRCAAAGISFQFSSAPNTLALVRVHATSKTNDRAGMCAGEFELSVCAGRFLTDLRFKKDNFNLGVARLLDSSLARKDYQLLRLTWANRSAGIMRPSLRAWLKLHPRLAKLFKFRW